MNQDKAKQLKKFKFFATTLFILMFLGFIVTSLLFKKYDYISIKAFRSFFEAAMVGALADWFAVTAIFRKPMGLPIPHTNLIEKNKNDIGQNLGQFVHENFLNPEALKPYIEKLDAVSLFISWFTNNQNEIKKEFNTILYTIVNEINEDALSQSIKNILTNKINSLDVSLALNPAIDYVLTNKYHEKTVNDLLPLITTYVPQLKPVIKEKISKKAWGFGALVSEGVSDQIISEVQDFLQAMISNPNDSNRKAIEAKLYQIISDLKTNASLKTELTNLKNNLFTNQANSWLINIVKEGKATVLNQLKNENSSINQQVNLFIEKQFINLETNIALKNKLNLKIQTFTHQIVNKNAYYVTHLIHETIEKWDGKKLSQKMELEVGKDLQFIRINGTVIGGLIGLFIFFTSCFLL